MTSLPNPHVQGTSESYVSNYDLANRYTKRASSARLRQALGGFATTVGGASTYSSFVDKNPFDIYNNPVAGFAGVLVTGAFFGATIAIGSEARINEGAAAILTAESAKANLPQNNNL